MKKHIFIGYIIGFISCCVILSLVLYVLSMPKKEEVKFVPAPEGFAVMIFDEEEQDYVESDGIPIGGYKLNSEKSYCTNGGTIDKYNTTKGSVEYSIDGTDECVIYLDIGQQIYLADNGYTFSWDPIEEAVSYNIYSDGELLKTTTNTQIEIYNLYDDVGTYNITVKAVLQNQVEIEYVNYIEYTLERTLPHEKYIYKKSISTHDVINIEYDLPEFDYINVINAEVVSSGIFYNFSTANIDEKYCIDNPTYCLFYEKNDSDQIPLAAMNTFHESVTNRLAYIPSENVIKFTPSGCETVLLFQIQKKGQLISHWNQIYITGPSYHCGGGGGSD